MGYAETMQAGAARYGDVTAYLRREFGVRAEFTQTGGMCAAIEFSLEDGANVLVTSDVDTLPWEREALQGWGVGIYAPRVGCCSDTEPCYCVDGGPAGWGEDGAPDLEALGNAVREAMREYAATVTR